MFGSCFGLAPNRSQPCLPAMNSPVGLAPPYWPDARRSGATPRSTGKRDSIAHRLANDSILTDRRAHLPLLKTKAFFTFWVSGPTNNGTAGRASCALLSTLTVAFAVLSRPGRRSRALKPYWTEKPPGFPFSYANTSKDNNRTQGAAPSKAAASIFPPSSQE